MNKKELNKILADHKLWLTNSKKGIKASLSGANLSGAYLSGAYLSSANLSGANLSGAYLSGAYLSWTDLSGANLSGADLSGAYLSGAYLSSANLSRTDLSGAYLSGAYLSGANLSGANLSGANLLDANIEYIKSFTQIVCEGDIIVYKATANGIATLLIPKQAKRINYIGSRRCRAEFAKVLSIETISGVEVKKDNGIHDTTFMYEVGKVARPDSFDDNVQTECSHGIHFFLTKEEVKRWLKA